MIQLNLQIHSHRLYQTTFHPYFKVQRLSKRSVASHPTTFSQVDHLLRSPFSMLKTHLNPMRRDLSCVSAQWSKTHLLRPRCTYQNSKAINAVDGALPMKNPPTRITLMMIYKSVRLSGPSVFRVRMSGLLRRMGVGNLRNHIKLLSLINTLYPTHHT